MDPIRILIFLKRPPFLIFMLTITLLDIYFEYLFYFNYPGIMAAKKVGRLILNPFVTGIHYLVQGSSSWFYSIWISSSAASISLLLP
jgi:hypothetical protein